MTSPVTFPARVRQPFESAAPWLISALLLWDFLRGFALHPDPYALGQYFYTYEAGFLVRGLLGSLVTAVSDGEPLTMRALILPLSVFAYLAFIAILLCSFHRLRRVDADARRLDNLLFLVLLSGPLLVGIGATRGFHDTWVLGIGLGAWLALRQDRHLTAWVLMTLSMLIHEEIVFFLLPVFGWWWWLHPARRGWRAPPRATLTLAAMLASLFVIIISGRADDAQLALLVDKVRLALNTDYLERWANPYLIVNTARAGISDVITLVHLHRLGYLGHQFMLLPTAAFWLLGNWQLWRQRRYLDTAMLSLAMLLPHTIYLVAEDVFRYLPYTSLSSWLIVMHTLHRLPPLEPPARTSPRLATGLIVLILVQTANWDYDPVHYNARNSTPLLELIREFGDPSWVRPSWVNTPHA